MQNPHVIAHPPPKPRQWLLVYWAEFEPVRGKFKGTMIRRRYTLRCYADDGYRHFMHMRQRQLGGRPPYITNVELWRSRQRVL